MKVVLFCGGLGMRLRESADSAPKPMATIGPRPILWHVMKYYAHYGHKDFILCLGYKGDAIKNYFLNYDECVSNDFVLSGGKHNLTMLSSDIDDWRITFCDTGLHSNIGQRLSVVEKLLDGEEQFFANYSDGLTDLPLDDFAARFVRSGKVASFLLVKPTSSFHVVSMKDDYVVSGIQDLRASQIRINGGYFMFRREIFDYIRPGEELVEEPFHRLIQAEQLTAYEHSGFWTCMDTFKDKRQLEDLYENGAAPWERWRSQGAPR